MALKIVEIHPAVEPDALNSEWFVLENTGENPFQTKNCTLSVSRRGSKKRVELGSIVMCTAFRNAALLAKMAATLDHLSDGRLILGVGCGWHDPEYEAFGYPTDHKVGRFEEALTVIRGLIREGRADLAGRWVTATDAALVPPARPDLPILIAAKRPRMLELTARHADAWNLAWFGEPDERWATTRQALEDACVAVGRDPATLERTVGVNVRYLDLIPPLADGSTPPVAEGKALAGSVDDVAAGLRAYADEGTGHLIAALEPTTPQTVERFAQAVRRSREIAEAPASPATT